MVKKMVKYSKFILCIALILSLVAPSYAALSASDGSAFVTKAEFDSALADFNARLTTFEAGINSKIDSQVTSYLDRNGIWNGKTQELNNDWKYGFFLGIGSSGTAYSATGSFGGYYYEDGAKKTIGLNATPYLIVQRNYWFPSYVLKANKSGLCMSIYQARGFAASSVNITECNYKDGGTHGWPCFKNYLYKGSVVSSGVENTGWSAERQKSVVDETKINIADYDMDLSQKHGGFYFAALLEKPGTHTGAGVTGGIGWSFTVGSEVKASRTPCNFCGSITADRGVVKTDVGYSFVSGSQLDTFVDYFFVSKDDVVKINNISTMSWMCTNGYGEAYAFTSNQKTNVGYVIQGLQSLIY